MNVGPERAFTPDEIRGALMGRFGAPRTEDGLDDAIQRWLDARDAADGAEDDDGGVRDADGTEVVADDDEDEDAPGEAARLNAVVDAIEVVALYYYHGPMVGDEVDTDSPEFQAHVVEVGEVLVEFQ